MKLKKLKVKNQKHGFTLVELLVVMAILAILATVTLANFRTSQIKARDAQRKHDLRQIVNALEAYFSDHNGYPEASNGKIMACGCQDPGLACGWDDPVGQREFCDGNNTVYMAKVPGDPLSDPNHSYCYQSDGNYFKLYAILENEKDPEATIEVTCAGKDYNFGLASPNVPLVEEEE